MKCLLDTETCIEILRGNHRVHERLQTESPDNCGVSVISVFELFAGVERCRQPAEERRKIEMFLAPLHVYPFDIESALRASKIRWELERTGKPIGPYDLLIAAQSLVLSVTLVTGNRCEFDRIPGLMLDTWT